MSAVARTQGGAVGTLIGALTAGLLGYQQISEVGEALEACHEQALYQQESFLALIAEVTRRPSHGTLGGSVNPPTGDER